MAKDSSKGSGGGATKVLGSSEVPTRDDIVYGNATYGGLPVKYDSSLKADAENLNTEIRVSDKFFEHPQNIQQHILNHEVAHNWSDEMMRQHAGDWNEFVSKFVEKKQVPKTSKAYENGQREYYEGIYGDIGSSAIKETTTRAITEYLDNPTALKARSTKAFNEVRRFINKKLK